ncbi:MAG: hypothetical protein M1838_004326 [Thelocarpon superellum]|nr:MAG: hypothetical protein M1838_004326 [Thelocarpon superellum]
MTSLAGDHLRKHFPLDKVAIAFIYCDYNAADRTATNLIASLLKQLAQQASLQERRLPDQIATMYETHLKMKTWPNMQESLRGLRHVVDFFEQAFFIVDALDECRTQEGVRASLIRAIIELSADINVMVTSRMGSADIEQELASHPTLEIYAQSDDIRRYLDAHIEEGGSALAEIAYEDAGFRKEMLDTLIRNSQGMCLLPRLHLDALAQEYSKAEIRKALKSLPRDIITRYEMTFQRIQDQRQGFRLARDVLTWSCAMHSRPVLDR